MGKFIFVFATLLATIAHAEPPALDQQIQTMIVKSLTQLVCNMAVGSPGAIIASPERNSPDYYYHWVRDSALIVQALTRLLPLIEGTPSAARIHAFIGDFASFSKRLQESPTPYGLGEVRFNPDGSIDSSPWPRPQYDGPALRALALIRYLVAYKKTLSPQTVALMNEIIHTDLGAVVKYYNTPGYDLWEYSTGFHFYTRMVQAAAMREARLFYGENPTWRRAESELYVQLKRHWNPNSQVIAFNDGAAFDSDGHSIAKFPVRYDTSVALAVIHAGLPAPEFSVMDERVWQTLTKLEDYFLDAFPVNAGKRIGPAVGRHKGDGYYGGNAFFFLTAAYSEYSYRIASSLRQAGGALTADENRIATLRRILQADVARGTVFRLPDQDLAEGFATEGDAFLKTMLDAIPQDGSLAEQLSKVDGTPASAKNLSWSYASVLTAILQREEWHRSSVNFRALDFSCPRQGQSSP